MGAAALLLAVLGLWGHAHDYCAHPRASELAHSCARVAEGPLPGEARRLHDLPPQAFGVLGASFVADHKAVRLTPRELGELVRGADPEPPRPLLDTFEAIGGSACILHGACK